MKISQKTIDALHKIAESVPKVDYNSYVEYHNKTFTFTEELPLIPEATQLIAVSPTSGFLAKTKSNDFLFTAETQISGLMIPYLLSEFEYDESDVYEIYNDDDEVVEMNFEEVLLWTFEDEANEDFGAIPLVTQDLADKFPLL